MLSPILDLPRPVHILCLGTFINRAGTFLIPFLTLYLQKELHLGERFATRTMGLYGLGAIAASLFGGHFADWIGRRTVMLISLFGGAASLVAFSTLKSPWAIMTGLTAFAVIAEMYRPAASAMIGDLVDPQRRPHAFGLMYVAINLGFAVGPIIGGLLIQYCSFQWLFWGDAATSAAYGMIILFLIRETLPSRRRAKDSDGAAGSAEVHESISLAEAVRRILRDRVFLTFSLATLLISSVFMQSMSTFPLHLASLGISPQIYGWIVALNGMLIVLFQLPITHLLARFDRGTMVALAAVIVGVGFGLTALATTPWQFAATVVVWTLGEMMSAAFSVSIVSDQAPAALRGRYMGVFSMCYSLAMMLGVPLGGEILARYGSNAVWLTTFVASLAAAGLYYAIRDQTRGLAHREGGGSVELGVDEAPATEDTRPMPAETAK